MRLIYDAQDNIEKVLKFENRVARVSSAMVVLNIIGIEDPQTLYDEKKAMYKAKIGSLAQVDDYQLATQWQDRAIVYDICKEQGVMPYALYN